MESTNWITPASTFVCSNAVSYTHLLPAVHHGNGAVCRDRGGGENVPETILKPGTETDIPLDSFSPVLSEGIYVFSVLIQFILHHAQSNILLSAEVYIQPTEAIAYKASLAGCALYKKKEALPIRVNTIGKHLFLLVHGLSLTRKFAPVSLYEQEDYDERYDVC